MSEDLGQPTRERDAALLRPKKRRDLHGHVFAYIVVDAAVWAIWAATGAGDLWPMWLTGVWAIGLVFNAWDVYLRPPITENEVQREIDRLHPQQ